MPAGAVQAAGDFYKVIVENDTVRVLEYRGAPGSKTPMHGHPNVIAYAVTD
jgi:quercetin dioxygenase-like cupin family protein